MNYISNTTFIKRPDKNYIKIPKEIFKDETLDSSARDLFFFILSKPDNWFLNQKELATSLRVSKSKITEAFKKLKSSGYIIQSNVYKGTEIQHLYTINCYPNPENQDPENQDSEKQQKQPKKKTTTKKVLNPENQDPENQEQYKNNTNKNKELNKNNYTNEKTKVSNDMDKKKQLVNHGYISMSSKGLETYYSINCYPETEPKTPITHTEFTHTEKPHTRKSTKTDSNKAITESTSCTEFTHTEKPHDINKDNRNKEIRIDNKDISKKIYKKENEIVETDKCNEDYIFSDSTKEELEPSNTIQDTYIENKPIEVKIELENISEPETIQEDKMDAEQFKNNIIKQIKEKLNLFEDPNKLISKYSLEEVSKHLIYVDYFETNRLHEKVKDNLTVLFLNSLKSNSAPPLAFVNEQIEKQHKDKETLLEHASNIIGVRSMGREQRIVEIIQELTKEYQSYNTKLDTFLKEGIQNANNKRKRLKQYELSLIEKSLLTEDLTKKWNDNKYLTIRLCKQLVMIDIKKLFIAMKILLNQDRYLIQSFKNELQVFDNSLDKMFFTLENFILINSHKELEDAEIFI